MGPDPPAGKESQEAREFMGSVASNDEDQVLGFENDIVHHGLLDGEIRRSGVCRPNKDRSGAEHRHDGSSDEPGNQSCSQLSSHVRSPVCCVVCLPPMSNGTICAPGSKSVL